MRKLLILFVSALLPWLSVRSQKPIYKDAGQPVEPRVKDLLERMTLHEKVLQLNQYTFGENDNPNNIGTEVKNLPAEIGSLIYLHTDPKLRNRIQRKAMEESRLGIPILFGFEVIQGLRTVLGTYFRMLWRRSLPEYSLWCSISKRLPRRETV